MSLQILDAQLPRLAKNKLNNEANRGVPRLIRLLAHVNLLEYLDNQAPQYEHPPQYQTSELEDLADLLKEHIDNKTAGIPTDLDSEHMENDLLSKLGSDNAIIEVEEMLPPYQPPTSAITVAEVEVEGDD